MKVPRVCRTQVYKYTPAHPRPLEDLPYIKVPLHTLIKLTPQAYGCEAEFIRSKHFSTETLNRRDIAMV